MTVTRKELGLPYDWRVVENWCRKPFTFGLPTETKPKKKTRFDHVDFHGSADPGFWETFPSRELPEKPTTAINVVRFAELIHQARPKMTIHEWDGAKKSLDILSHGAPAYQLVALPGAKVKNAPSIMKCAAEFTETLEAWVEKGYVSGPFFTDPLPDMRINSVMAEEQKDKVRPVINMSSPKGRSFNDNVDKDLLGRSPMSSAKQFGEALRKSGKGSMMSKMDMKDAYKLIPAKTEDYRLQGFSWYGAVFVETQQMFGATPAVNNFDTPAKTIQVVARTMSKIPKEFVKQTLDDTASVGPQGSMWCEEFTENYKEVCRQLNIELASNCPNGEKAFTNSTMGTVLGIRFNSDTLSWKLPGNKVSDILTDIHTFLVGGHVCLKQTQQLVGRLNNLCQMCPFLKGFRRPLHALLASFGEDENVLLPVALDLMEDLRVWAAATCEASCWMPIADSPQLPPVSALQFTSDAAGGLGTQEWAGVASLGHNTEQEVWFMCRGQWPPNIKTDEDEKGAAFKSKMTSLELVGLFLPFLTMPELLRGRHVILRVDNRSVVHAWQNKSVKGDITASVLVRALMVVCAFLECQVYVGHTKRNTTTASYLADCLTRDTTAHLAWPRVQNAMAKEPPGDLWDWLSNPTTDWQLGFKLVDTIKINMMHHK